MNVTGVWLIAGAVALMSLRVGTASAMDAHTPCTAAIRASDTSSAEQMREVFLYVRETMVALDDVHTQQGEPGIMAQLSDQGMIDMVAMTVTFCRKNPKATVYNTAAKLYRETRDLEVALGAAQ